MKKLYIIFLLSLVGSTVFAQEKNAPLSKVISEVENPDKELIRNAEDLKSGNYKDVFYSFFQLAVRDFTGKEKSFGFNSTLFAIKVKADPLLLRDKNFKNESFSRNFQFNFRANLDSVYNFKGFTGGVTYAIINQRDRKLADFSGTLIDATVEKVLNSLQVQRAKYQKIISGSDPAERKKLLADLQVGIDHLVNEHNVKLLPEAFLEGIDSKALVTTLDEIATLREKAFSEIDKKWLWTVGVNGTTSTSLSRFNRASFNTVILKGDNPEVDVRGIVTYSDTLLDESISRVRLASSAGLNFTLLKTKNIHLLEFKPYLEYNSIIMNPLVGEEKNRFLANAEVRFRVTDHIWIPLTLKYDLKDANFLGFLNVSVNLDGLNN